MITTMTRKRKKRWKGKNGSRQAFTPGRIEKELARRLREHREAAQGKSKRSTKATKPKKGAAAGAAANGDAAGVECYVCNGKGKRGPFDDGCLNCHGTGRLKTSAGTDLVARSLPLGPAPIEPLGAVETRDLARLEKIVRKNLAAYFSVGLALAEIRDRRLFRASHATFTEYALDRFGLSKSDAYQQIAAAQASRDVSAISEKLRLELNPSHFRSLVKLDEASDRVEVLKRAAKQAPRNAQGAPVITAKLIEQTCHEYMGFPEDLEREAQQKAERKTTRSNLSPSRPLVIDVPSESAAAVDADAGGASSSGDTASRTAAVDRAAFETISLGGTMWTWGVRPRGETDVMLCCRNRENAQRIAAALCEYAAAHAFDVGPDAWHAVGGRTEKRMRSEFARLGKRVSDPDADTAKGRKSR
jgi:hypothetical protein